MVRDEPLASVVQEAFEGSASGRFQTQTEVKRFFERQPAFPINRPNGEISFQRVTNLLTRSLYAGYIEVPNWKVSLREGHHEGLIDDQTFQRIQLRLKDGSKAPYRKDLSEDFPLCGFVTCGDCSKPMTSSWSTGYEGKKHPYYMCFGKGCSSYRKSIRRDELEGHFEALLCALQPSLPGIELCHRMFTDIWEHRLAQAKEASAKLKRDVAKIETQITSLLDRIVEASSLSVVTAYERRIHQLEDQKLILAEQARDIGKPARPFEETFRTAMHFLANPQKNLAFRRYRRQASGAQIGLPEENSVQAE